MANLKEQAESVCLVCGHPSPAIDQCPICDGKQEVSGSDLVCQFCGEGSFDLIGLKGHIQNGWCEAFSSIQYPPVGAKEWPGPPEGNPGRLCFTEGLLAEPSRESSAANLIDEREGGK